MRATVGVLTTPVAAGFLRLTAGALLAFSLDVNWCTLSPGQTLWDAPRQRTQRIADCYVGRVLAHRYRLGRLLDDAALCATYEAHEIETGQAVSIELLAPPKGAGLPTGALLRRCAGQICGARHASLRVVRSIGEEAGVPFIVADPISGESLRMRLARSGPMPVGESVAMALQIIDAVAAGHAVGLVHGNLKPEKIRLRPTPHGAPLVTVMGLGVTALLATMRDVDTRTVGTPPYLAPERLTGFETPDELTDVWGIGLLVFEMIAGTPAFDGSSADEVGRRIAVEGPNRLRRLRPLVPISIERIVAAALARRPEQRLSLRDLRRALLSVQAECTNHGQPNLPTPTRDVIFDLADPCDDFEGTTDLHVFVETDLGEI